jgi:hypothetical protein
MLLRALGLATVLLSSVIALGCADGGGGPGGGGDAGRLDAARDGSTTPPGDAGPRDGGRRDSAVTCASGQHACGGGCVDDQPNEPENGCRFGCGEECPTPASGTASCSAAGACDFACAPPFRREGEACVCSAATCEDIGAECGAPDDGCGTMLDCGTCASGMCLAGRCGCTPDPHEPNDSNTTATRGAEMSDSDDPDVSFSDYTIDEATDADWLVFHVLDGTDGGNPRINVRLSGIPVGSDYDLAAFYVCDEGGDLTSCNTGSADNLIGHGCSSATAGAVEETVELDTDCDRTFSADDPGQFYVRVTSRTFGGSCAPYQLAIMVR